jgi:hypothetical protein
MLALEFAQDWIQGRWLPPGYSSNIPVAGNSLTDIFGVAITVGAKVKLIGTVTSMNPTDPHFQDIEIRPDYPQSAIIAPEAGVFPQNIPVKSYKFHPLQLIVMGTTNL